MTSSSGDGQWVSGVNLDGAPVSFQLRGLLGKGGMASVYKAWDAGLQREVALKVLDGALTEMRLARFQREGQAAATLKHPNVIRVHGAGVIEQRPYLTYELVEGAQPLDEAWRTQGLEQRLDLLETVIEAVAHAHAQGVVHRDLKPENVLVDAEGRARVTDFGLAFVASETERLTVTGAMMGSPRTMAPEQISGSHEQRGPATDVWALGVLLYLALTGAWPFEGATLTELMAQIARAQPIPPQRLAPEGSYNLAGVCARALAAKAAARYPDASALVEALRDARARSDPRPVWPLGLALLALALVAAGVALRPRAATPSPTPTPTLTPTPRPAPDTAQAPSPTPSATASTRRGLGRAELRLLPSTHRYELPTNTTTRRVHATPKGLWLRLDVGKHLLYLEREEGSGLPARTVLAPAPARLRGRGVLLGDTLYVACGGGKRSGAVVGIAAATAGRARQVWSDPEFTESSDLRLTGWIEPSGERSFVLSLRTSAWRITLNAQDEEVSRKQLELRSCEIEDLGWLSQRRQVIVAAASQGMLPALLLVDPESGEVTLSTQVFSIPETPLEGLDGSYLVGSRTGHVVRYIGSKWTFFKDPTTNGLVPAHPGSSFLLVRAAQDSLYSLSGSTKLDENYLCAWDLRNMGFVQRFRVPGERITGMGWDPVLQAMWLGFKGRLELRPRPLEQR